jgi:hypothetical protein
MEHVGRRTRGLHLTPSYSATAENPVNTGIEIGREVSAIRDRPLLRTMTAVVKRTPPSQF